MKHHAIGILILLGLGLPVILLNIFALGWMWLTFDPDAPPEGP